MKTAIVEDLSSYDDLETKIREIKELYKQKLEIWEDDIKQLDIDKKIYEILNFVYENYENSLYNQFLKKLNDIDLWYHIDRDSINAKNVREKIRLIFKKDQ